MESRARNAEETLLVNYGCFFPTKGYIKTLDGGKNKQELYHKIHQEETWFIQNDEDDDYTEPLTITRFTTTDNRSFQRQSRRVKTFLEIDYIQLVIKKEEEEE